MIMNRASAAIAYIVLSASSASAAYSYYCNRPQCCWALRVNHWNIHDLCYGCEGQDVCNPYPYTPRRPTYRPTNKPTNKPTNAWNVWRNDGWNGDGYGDYCCQTIGSCPIETPVVVHRQWLDRVNRVRQTFCCQKGLNSWQGDSWRGGSNGNGRSLQNLLPVCINTDMPTSTPTLSPITSPTASPLTSPSVSPSKSPSNEPSNSPSTSLKPSASSKPSSSSSPSQSSKPSLSSMPSTSSKPSLSSKPSSSSLPSQSSKPSLSSMPSTSTKPSLSSSPSQSSKPT